MLTTTITLVLTGPWPPKAAAGAAAKASGAAVYEPLAAAKLAWSYKALPDAAIALPEAEAIALPDAANELS